MFFFARRFASARSLAVLVGAVEAVGNSGGGGGSEGGGGSSGTTAGTYIVTITGTSESTAETGMVTFTVQ